MMDFTREMEKLGPALLCLKAANLHPAVPKDLLQPPAIKAATTDQSNAVSLSRSCYKMQKTCFDGKVK